MGVWAQLKPSSVAKGAMGRVGWSKKGTSAMVRTPTKGLSVQDWLRMHIAWKSSHDFLKESLVPSGPARKGVVRLKD